MKTSEAHRKAKRIPKKRARHYSYNESVDEPGKVLEEEATDIEREAPLEDAEPIDSVEPEDRDSPVFEE